MADDDGTPILRPREERGRFSVARLARQWYVALESRRLRRGPVAVTVLGLPLVLFRDGSGRPAALLDRCPHRNVPLSLGAVEGGGLQCAYHGWRFAADGACAHLPARAEGPEGAAARAAPRGVDFPCREQQGFVWVWPTARAEPGGEPAVEPYRIPGLETAGYAVGRLAYELDGTLHAVLENILDVPHTAFLHRGLFRSPERTREIEVVVRRTAAGAEAEFLGEERPRGLAGRLLAPGGGTVTHVDRFLLPSIAQVEYGLGPRTHLIATHLLTPVGDHRTAGHLVVAARLPFPAWLVRGLFRAVALRLLEQDRRMLRAQDANVRRFGGERFASTETDLLGGHIWALLRRAERREREGPAGGASGDSDGLVTGAPGGGPGAGPEETGPAVERRIRMRV